ncbi:hypothetical protein MNEG_5164 [Monoraphidium neglectum]|uniref:Uncharacterized protein n=1 Tax=Monoraphidium neglectum TaxID=145388 RepID=A0A0D2MID5_9CHLO|nr:hypothetical protein MNEG_5164 [Monoraphidium neglectum]KIZ02795.1 hypothetical protein MNEG_5164 [Monoraphidium neglectum]|eukprot:XP_013901814.1 hypothetical protein MNEG_5164 [Monoraphidium neglectum]
MPAAAVGKAPKVKALRPGQVVTNTLGTGGASKPRGYSSFIEFYRAATRARDPPCFAAGCRGRGTSGGHVKLAPSPLLAAFKLSWYIVPACPAHNKRSSCGSYQVKAGTLAVRVETSLADRVCSLPADGKKLVAAAMGKHHL